MLCKNNIADFNSEISFIISIEKNINIQQMKSLKLEQICELNSEETTVILFKNFQLSIKLTKKKKLTLNNK